MGVTLRVYVKLCVNVCVEDAVCSSGLGTAVHPPPVLCLCVCVSVLTFQ